jgi:hypothetical protein
MKKLFISFFRWKYVAVSIVLRIEEFAAVFSTNVFLYVKKPSADKESSSKTLSTGSNSGKIDTSDQEKEDEMDISLEGITKN